MTAKPVDLRARLADWRARQLDRYDPVAFAVMEALQARATQHHGAARARLEQRLDERMQAYAARLPRGRARTAPSEPVRATPLTALVADLAQRPPAACAPLHAIGPSQVPAAYPALPAIDEFRALWATVRSRSQVRRSLDAAPTDGGPLNSAVLVHRAMALMGELSPGYLSHFLAYMDNLSWLDQLQPRAAAPTRDVGRIAKPRRARTAKP